MSLAMQVDSVGDKVSMHACTALLLPEMPAAPQEQWGHLCPFAHETRHRSGFGAAHVLFWLDRHNSCLFTPLYSLAQPLPLLKLHFAIAKFSAAVVGSQHECSIV